ncbi:MAG: RNA 2'-phosphotransferase, partial [Firmicutes bacterium]|nr:RNA 2'-phosphotransferase [Bacillota bacterium]
QELLDGLKNTYSVTMSDLEEIVATDEKQRYSFNADKTMIRANQGHSIPVDVELTEQIPPVILFHGTGEKYMASIEQNGLIPKSRLYVHLSADYETALKVGKRHGKSVVYEVDSNRMSQDGYLFYKSVNGVWLTSSVPSKYLHLINQNTDALYHALAVSEQQFEEGKYKDARAVLSQLKEK